MRFRTWVVLSVVVAWPPVARGEERTGGVDLLASAPAGPPLTVCAKVAEVPGSGATAGAVIPGATVILLAPDGSASAGTTGSDGCAIFDPLPPGKYRVTVASQGAQPADGAVEVRERGGARLDLALAIVTADAQEVVVEASREGPGETRHTLTPQEVDQIAGSANDALKGVQNLPGVARSPYGVGQLVVRGSDPSDTTVYLDGQQIPQLYHFGGLNSVVPTEVLSRIDFLPGGFGVRYGRAIGGVVDVETRPGRDEKQGGFFDVDLYGANGEVEGPVPRNGGHYFAAARRSYIDAVLPALAPVAPQANLNWTVAPRYYDYQLRYDLPSTASAQAHLLAYGSDDALQFVQTQPGAGGLRGAYNFRTAFHQIQAPITWPLAGKWLFSLNPGLAYQYLLYDDSGSAVALNGTRVLGSLRAETRGPLAPGLTLLAGVDGDLEQDTYQVDYADDGGSGVASPDRQTIASASYALTQGGAYTELEAELGHGVTLVPGVRADAYTPQMKWSADPRLAIRWRMTDATWTKAYAGLYHQPPLFYEWDPKLGNPGLAVTRAFQTGLGGGRTLGESMEISGETFYKWIDDLPVTLKTAAAVTDPTSHTEWSSQGLGRVYGVEVLFKRDLSERLHGWLSYTLSRSERWAPDGDGWTPFDYDQTHNLCLVASYRMERGWIAAARFRYVTGNPTVTVDQAVFDSDQNSYYAIPGLRHDSRLPDFNQLDLRVDKRWEWSGWTLDAYLDVQNVYDAPNPEGVQYDFTYDRSAYVNGLPVFPSFGIRGEF